MDFSCICGSLSKLCSASFCLVVSLSPSETGAELVNMATKNYEIWILMILSEKFCTLKVKTTVEFESAKQWQGVNKKG